MATFLEGKSHDLGGGMIVSRVIPQAKKRMVGPFAFFDHMGPVIAKAGQNIDVRPHPHIGLSTLTYLFDGRIVHRDSIGSVATIVPGEVNWMTAGRGISHSERTHEDDRARDRKLHGLQFWIALPDGQEEVEPSFQHYDVSEIPKQDTPDYHLELIAGRGFGLQSKVKTSSPLILAKFVAKNSTGLEVDFSGFEIAAYVVRGSVECDGQTVNDRQMLILDGGKSSTLRFSAQTEFILLGGQPFATPRHIWWNLVSSSKERIELAKQQWINGQFPMVPGEVEFIPAPD